MPKKIKQSVSIADKTSYQERNCMGCLVDVVENEKIENSLKENNTRDSNVVPHRSTNRARACLTSLSRREAVLSC